MIRRFKYSGLKRLYKDDVGSGVKQDHLPKLRGILSNLDVARDPKDLRLPGYQLHELKGDRKGVWSIKVSGNWRVTFRFDGQDVTDVDYEDYH